MSVFLPKFLEVSAPWAMRHCWPAGQSYTSEPMKFYSLWLVVEGEIRVGALGREWVLREDTASLFPPACTKEIATPQGVQFLSVPLRATVFGQVDLFQLLMPPVVWQPQERDLIALRQAMNEFAQEWACGAFPSVTPDNVDEYVTHHYLPGVAPDATGELLCDCYARTIVTLCWRMLGKIDLSQVASQGLPDWLAGALAELSRDPDISVEQLAHKVGISPTHLRRHFQKWFGSSPREYMNRLRLEEARQLLETSEMPVSEIAERIGFLSTPHFNRLFKQTFGLPPAQYRHLSRMSVGQSK